MPYDDLCMQSIGMSSQREHQCQKIASVVEEVVEGRHSFAAVVSMPSCLLVVAEVEGVVAGIRQYHAAEALLIDTNLIISSIRILITISWLRLWRSIVSVLLWWSSYNPSAWLLCSYA